MRKLGIALLCLIFTVLGYFTVVSAIGVFKSDWKLPAAVAEGQEQIRLVLITRNLETSFWDEVAKGARRQAAVEGVSLEVWGSYSGNEEDFLEGIEVAIHSKADGIIVQGLDTERFKELAKIKASFHGIPLITVANDVPMEESLRKTYVGSDQYKAGQLIAGQLLVDMGPEGHVILLSDEDQEHYQKQRLAGIRDMLERYPNVTTVYGEAVNTEEQVTAVMRDLLNNVPEADAIIAVNSDFANPVIEEIERRSLVEPYYIYSFDDGAELLPLLEQGEIDGMVSQSPVEMGVLSVDLITDWLNGETVPLDREGYITPIRMVKAGDVR